MNLSAHPVQLDRTDSGLVIVWSDGFRQAIALRELRDACPCATCREKRTESDAQPAALLPVISMEEAQPLAIDGMKPVGNYAYGIAFSDGHDTGIFTFELLRSLGSESA